MTAARLEIIIGVALQSPDTGEIFSTDYPQRHHRLNQILYHERHLNDWNQGFLTSEHRYVSREEALPIAEVAHQIKGEKHNPLGKLMSEDMWSGNLDLLTPETARLLLPGLG